MTIEKSVNYTHEQTNEMIEQYQSGLAVEFIAQAVGKSVRSVVAKLSREGVYVNKAKSTASRVTKTQLVTKISTLIDVPVEKLESLEKANSEALELVLKALDDYEYRLAFAEEVTV